MINKNLPVNAEDIFVEWSTNDGGVGVIAFTDEEANPYIGLYPINRIGKPNGLPCWFRRKCLMSDMLIGFKDDKPLIIFIDIEVSERGLSLIVFIPVQQAQSYQRHTFTSWNSKRSSYNYTTFPSNSNWVLNPLPKGGEE